MNGHLDICRLIIDNVDNKHPANIAGKTPMTLVEEAPFDEWKRKELAQLFES